MGPELRLLQRRQRVAETVVAPRSVILLWFGLSLSLFPSISFSFIFLPGPRPSEVTATIVCCEVQSRILMKCRTSSVHFNRQRVSNSQSLLLTPNRLCDRALSKQNMDLLQLNTYWSLPHNTSRVVHTLDTQ